MKTKILSRIGYAFIIFLLLISITHFYVSTAKFILPTSGFVEHPGPYEGITRAILGIYAGTSPEGFLLRYNQRLILVKYSQKISPPRYGQILVYGTFHQEGYIEAHQTHNYDYNYIIYVISFLAFLFVIALFCDEWKITRRGVESA